uniref:30S ribosomal protein S6, chloroplastic n=1 Tax=Pleurostichidium falkenbergii TaxID=121064 RepID=A0A4D6UYM8_9FLOR|nr:ribosomal protein S6 [Pleurostichidium falkenbergii]QCH39593.1 ribosomal protein S6 [Pleurostichidium falkenbergii]
MIILNTYETIYILKPDVTDDINLSLVKYYKALLKERGAINILVQHRGRRHLSYNISHYYDGIYVQMNYQANGNLVKFLEKSMRFNDNIVRYLTVKQRKNIPGKLISN